MPSVTLSVEADVATRRDSVLAAGLGDHLPVGYWSGAIYRSALRFPIPAGWAGWSGITSATLNLYVTDHQHVGVRNSLIYVRRNGGTLWTKAAGTQDCESGFSAGNNTQADDVASATTDQVQFNSGSTVNLKRSVSVTALVAWYRDSGQSKIVLILDPVGTADYAEFWSKEHGTTYDATLDIVYTVATVPNAPTLTYPDPTGGSIPETRPRFAWTPDPAAGPQTGADIVVKQGATTLTTLHPVNPTDGFVTCDVDLPRGVAIDYSVATYNASGVGPAKSGQFSVMNLPVVTIDATRRMVFANGAPRLVVQWTVDQVQASYRVQTASGYDSGVINGTASSHTLTTRTLTDNVAETITVTVVSTAGLTGSASRAFTPRYGLSSHRRDLGSVPIAWVGTTIVSTVPTDATLQIEYGSAATALAAPTGGWFSTLSAVPRLQFLYWRAWFIPSAAAGPTLDKITIATTNTSAAVDKWGTTKDAPGLVAPWSIDVGESVYGAQSMRADGAGGGASVVYSYKVSLRAGRTYTLSGLMKTVGNAGAQFRLADAADNSLAASPILAATTDWFDPVKRDTNRYRTPAYSAASDMDAYVQLRVAGTAGTTAWFDGIKLEESTVATPWSPAAIGSSVVDAAGVQIDGSEGGIFRYKGTNGAARSIVGGGAAGLLFAGDTELTSPSAGVLAIGGVPIPMVGRAPQVVRGPTATTALTNAEADVPQMTLTVGPGTFLITGIFAFDISATNPSLCSGRLSVDGVTQAGEAEFLLSSTTTGRSTVQMTWLVTIAGAGVLKLRALKGLATGTAQAVAGQCALLVQ